MEGFETGIIKGWGELMGKITEGGLISVHVVAAIVVGAIWTTRLNDRVDSLEKAVVELTAKISNTREYRDK